MRRRTSAHVLIARACDALIMRAVATLIGGRHQAYQAAQLPPVLDLPPAEDFGRQHPGADRADPAKRGQGVDIPAHCGPRIRRERRALGIQFRKRAVQKLELRPATLEPCSQAGRNRRPVPQLRGLEPRQKIRFDRQLEPLRGQQSA